MSTGARSQNPDADVGGLRRLRRWLARAGRGRTPRDALLETVALCRAGGADAVRQNLSRLAHAELTPVDLLRRAANLALDSAEPEVAVQLAPMAVALDDTRAMQRWAALVETRAGMLGQPVERLRAAGVSVNAETPNAHELLAVQGLLRLREQPPQVQVGEPAGTATGTTLLIAGDADAWVGELLASCGQVVRTLALSGWPPAPGDGAGAGVPVEPDRYLDAAVALAASRLQGEPADHVAAVGDLWIALPAMLAARRLGMPFLYFASAPLPPPPASVLDERGRFLHNLRALVVREAELLLAGDAQVLASLEIAGAPLERVVLPDTSGTERLGALLRRGRRPEGPAVEPPQDIFVDADDPDPTAWLPQILKRGQSVVLCGKVEGGQFVSLRLDASAEGPERPKGLLAQVRYLDGDGNPLPHPYPDCSSSERFPAYFYAAVTARRSRGGFGKTLAVPAAACRLELTVGVYDRGPVPRLDRRPRLECHGDALPAWQPRSLVSNQTYRQAVQASAGDRVLLSLHLEDTEASPKAVVAEIVFLDRHGNALKGGSSDLASSNRYLHYVYGLSSRTGQGVWQHHGFVVPAGTVRVEMRLHAHQATPALLIKQRPGLRVLRSSELADLMATFLPDPAWLAPAVAVAQAEGALTLMSALLKAWVHAAGAPPEVVRRWQAVQSELVELEPAWYPAIRARRRLPEPGRLTVCHLHKTAYPYENSGGAIRCLNTLKSQRELGLDPYVITPPGYPGTDGVAGAAIHETVDGIDHYRIGPQTGGVKTLSLPARTTVAAVQAAMIVGRRGASLIHAASGVRGYELALQAFALRDMYGLPVVYEVRSFHEHTWAPASPRIFELERTQLRIAKENRCMAMADHVVTISESMRRILIERGVPEAKIDVVPNAIDAMHFQGEPRAADLPALHGASAVVGYISNMSRREGHLHLLEAVARLRTAGLDVRCLFVGDGPERASLERRAQTMGLTPVTVFTGEVDHHDVQAYYRAIDVFVVPRIPDYAADWVTPLKPYEAMALGRPLVVTDLPALREVVGDGDRGRIARTADAESLAAEIRILLDDPGLRDAQAARARAWVFEHRTWAANARRYEDIYRRVIESRQVRPESVGQVLA